MGCGQNLQWQRRFENRVRRMQMLEVEMKIVVRILTALLGIAACLVGQASEPLPDGVYIQSFEFRPIFTEGEEERERIPLNANDPFPTRPPPPGGDPSIQTLKREPRRERLGFEVYLLLKNSATRAIKKLEWDFLFLDSESGSELKKFSITSKSMIRSGEVRFLTKQVLPGLFLGNKTKPDFARGKPAVVIRSIEFADGSKWQGSVLRQQEKLRQPSVHRR